jgi:6-phosphogluconolactonase (cycloisomerase 2 family)
MGGTSRSTPKASDVPIQEEASTIMLWHFNPATGALRHIRSFPVCRRFTGTDFTSEIRVSADGNFVYGANRLSDTIGVFSIGRDGTLTPDKLRFSAGIIQEYSLSFHRTVHRVW